MGRYGAGLLESDAAYELRAAVLQFAGLDPDDFDELDPDEVGTALTRCLPDLVQLLQEKDYDEDDENAEMLVNAEADKTVYAVIADLVLDFPCTLSYDDHAVLAAGLAELPLLAESESSAAARAAARDEDDDVEDDQDDQLLADDVENLRQLAADFDDLVTR